MVITIDTQGLLELTINIFLLKGNTLSFLYYKENSHYQSFRFYPFDVLLYVSFNHAFLIIGGGMHKKEKKMIIHIEEFTNLRMIDTMYITNITTTTTISVETVDAFHISLPDLL
jgi:hypothetical protein